MAAKLDPEAARSGGAADAPIDASGHATVRTRRTLDRIRRLEQVEIDRLEAHERQQRARERKLEGAADAAGLPGSALERFERRADVPMAVVGIVWFVALVFALRADFSHTTELVVVAILLATWTIALVEFVVRLVLAPDTKRYVAARRIEPVTVAVPVLQGLRLYGLTRTDLIVRELILRTKAVLLHRGLFRVLIATFVFLVLAAWLVMLTEGPAKGSNIHSYWEALWWSIVTVTTVGYGDRFPVTALGRVVAVGLMLVGIGLIGVLTATVASFFMREHVDEHKEQLKAAHDDLGGRIADLAARMDRFEALLGASLGAGSNRANEATQQPRPETPADPDGSTR